MHEGGGLIVFVINATEHINKCSSIKKKNQIHGCEISNHLSSECDTLTCSSKKCNMDHHIYQLCQPFLPPKKHNS